MHRPLPFARRLGATLLPLFFVAVAATPADGAAEAADAPDPAASLAELAAAIDAPQAGDRLGGEPIAIGRGVVEPGAGAVVRRLLCAGEPCGAVVEGPARFRYRVEDRFSRPVAARNLRRVSSAKPVESDDAVTVEVPLKGAVIWSWELPAGAPAAAGSGDGSGEAVPAPGGPGLPGWAAEILGKSLFTPPSHDLVAARRLIGGGEVYALLHGDEDWLLSVDPVDALEEGLWKIDRLNAWYDQFKGYALPRELAAQPIGRAWWDPSPSPSVATHLSIALDNPEGAQATLRTRARVQAARDGVGVWRVSLAERDFDNDGREVPNTVRSVTVGGRPAGYLHAGGELVVAIDPPLAAGQTAEIEVVNGGALAIRPGNDSFWTMFGPVHPWPPADGTRATVEVEVRVPKPFTPFASGSVVERRSEDGHEVLRSRLDHPTQYPVIAAGKYEVFEDVHNGRTARVASYAGGKEKASRQLLSNLHAAADFYQQLFGVPYPFEEVVVLEYNSWGFGVAPAGMIFITQEAYNPIGDITSRFFSEGINERYVHEVAHGFWGHVSRAASSEEAWLNESFSEYSAALCLQAMRGGGKAGQREFDKLLRQWISRTQQIGDGASLYLAQRLGAKEGDDSAARDYAYLVYAKGPVVLHALRQELARQQGGAEQGDRYFFALLRTFLQHVEPGWGETRHLVGILDQITGRDWQPWFERYVYGTETPKVDV